MNRALAPGLALLAGLLHTAAFAPLEWPALQVLALAALVGLAWHAPPARAAALAMAFGLGWLGGGWWWLYISMHRYGGLAAPLAVLAVVLLAAAMSLYAAAALALWARLRAGGKAGVGSAVVLFAGAWLAAELARASWFTGFPWSASGYAHTTGPLAAWAPWIGVYGITALGAAVSAALAALGVALWGRRHKAVRGHAAQAHDRPAAGVAAIWLIGLALLATGVPRLLPKDFTEDTGMLSVSLVQPAIAQDLKFDPGRFEANLMALVDAVAQARGALVVTPESVVPLPFDDVHPTLWAHLQALVSAPGRGLLLGVFLPDGQGRYVNSMIGLSAHSDPAQRRFYHYGKRHLLPFGEFVPPGFRWFVDLMNIPLDDQAAGRSERSFALAGQRLRPLICFEDLFGEDFAVSVIGPESATVFVNASNLAWFGPRMVQDQHLQFSRMRALEFQRPVVRATNTGATAAVDHQGRVMARLPPEVADTLEVSVQGRRGVTPYAAWLAAGASSPLGPLAPLWATAVLALLLGRGSVRRAARQHGVAGGGR